MRDLRGTGFTSRQMENAPDGAVFVWCNGHLDYPKRLAEHLGRKDLRIESIPSLVGEVKKDER